MSDSGVETESALLSSGLNLHSDIVVKGQHYSGNSCSGRFLDVVQPRLIIATSRDFPPNERISDNWAEDLRTRGIKLFRQDQMGAVTVRFGRNGWEAQSYLTGEVFRSSSQ
jgi:beta-lactamase superfamily II metal-dependent hydrolase